MQVRGSEDTPHLLFLLLMLFTSIMMVSSTRQTTEWSELKNQSAVGIMIISVESAIKASELSATWIDTLIEQSLLGWF